MTLWEIVASIDGFNRINGTDASKPEPMSDEEFDELLDVNTDVIA
jgi:hypothetical protein